MKKFISCFVAMLMVFSFCNLNAQTVKSSDIFDNIFGGINVGAVAPYEHSFDWANHGVQPYRFEAGAELGKWITPVVGFSVNDEVQVNTTGVHTAFDVNVLNGDVHFNLTNLFLGYNGSPRSFELELVPAMGWRHYFVSRDLAFTGNHCNFVEYRVALSADYNFGKDKEWAVYFRPGVQCFDRFRSYNGQFDVRVGLTYKFKGRQSHSHNFVLCPFSRTEEEYEDLAAKYESLKNRPAEVKEVVKEVIVNNNVPVAQVKNYTVTFAFNSAELSSDAKNTLNSIPENSIVDIDTYASAHGGNQAVNQIVSDKRAAAVKAYLENRGIRVDGVRSHGAETDYSEQIAVVTIK